MVTGGYSSPISSNLDSTEIFTYGKGWRTIDGKLPKKFNFIKVAKFNTGIFLFGNALLNRHCKVFESLYALASTNVR